MYAQPFPAQSERIHARVVAVKFTGNAQLGFRATAQFTPISPLPPGLSGWTGKLHLEGDDAKTLLAIGKGGIASIDLVWPEGYKAPYSDGLRAA